MKTILNIIKKIGKWIWLFFSTIFLVLFFAFWAFNDDEKEDLETKKEKEKDELKKTSANDIIATSNNQSDIQSGIKQEQDKLRQRIRDRLNKKL